jgi:hypothetical protein
VSEEASETVVTEKWVLRVGTHRGTAASMNAEPPREYDSLDACREAFVRNKRQWDILGYNVWYARAQGPNGDIQELHPGDPCV